MRDRGGGLRLNFPDQAPSCATLTPFQIWASVFGLDRARPRWRTRQPKRTAVVSRLTDRWPVNETGAVQRARDVLTSSIARLTIVVSWTTNLEIEMSKPRLLLIHCSNGIRQGAKHGQRGRSFRPLVIHGGARARSAPRESSWEAAFELVNLGLLVSHSNYLAFLQASITVLEACNRTDPYSQ